VRESVFPDASPERAKQRCRTRIDDRLSRSIYYAPSGLANASEANLLPRPPSPVDLLRPFRACKRQQGGLITQAVGLSFVRPPPWGSKSTQAVGPGFARSPLWGSGPPLQGLTIRLRAPLTQANGLGQGESQFLISSPERAKQRCGPRIDGRPSRSVHYALSGLPNSSGANLLPRPLA
jgi:hypothetical protein